MRYFLCILFALLCGCDAKADTKLLVFGATWCGPCHQMEPTVNRIEKKGYAVKRVDFDSEKKLVQKYRVTSVPTFIVVKNGHETSRRVGVTSERDLIHALKSEEEFQILPKVDKKKYPRL